MTAQSIQGYLVLGKIKEGSVGPVWRVSNSRNQVFAIKQMSARAAADPAQVRRFDREADLTKKLTHPGILKVYERLDCDPPAFVMEFFESENLKYALWNVPERIVGHEFRILRQVAEALAYVHEQGVVHKDIKPENVLVNAARDARLIDFSLAQTKKDRLLQFAKRVDGTPLYMAPEQIRGEKVDPSSPLPGDDPGRDPGQAPEGGPGADADLGAGLVGGSGRPGVEDAGQGPGGAAGGHEGGAPRSSEVGAEGYGGPGAPGGPPAPAEAKVNPGQGSPAIPR